MLTTIYFSDFRCQFQPPPTEFSPEKNCGVEIEGWDLYQHPFPPLPFRKLIKQNHLWVSMTVWMFETTEVGICVLLKARGHCKDLNLYKNSRQLWNTSFTGRMWTGHLLLGQRRGDLRVQLWNLKIELVWVSSTAKQSLHLHFLLHLVYFAHFFSVMCDCHCLQTEMSAG